MCDVAKITGAQALGTAMFAAGWLGKPSTRKSAQAMKLLSKAGSCEKPSVSAKAWMTEDRSSAGLPALGLSGCTHTRQNAPGGEKEELMDSFHLKW